VFINNINPVLLNLGPFEIRYYGLVYALGFIAAYLLLLSIAKKRAIKNFTIKNVDILIIYFILGLVIGARLLLFVFYHPATLITNPLEVFMLWHGGMSFHGGLIGAAVAGLLFCRKYKVSFYQLGDLLVLPAALFLFFGRIANFINSELYGNITTPDSTPWCVVFKRVDDYCRHPSQLYEALKNLIIFITLSILYFDKEIKRKLKDGVIFWLFVLLYGGLRFIITFWRDDPRWLGLSMGQYLSLVMVIASIIFLFRIIKGKKREEKNKIKNTE